jgi:hypothetical protein
VSKQSSVLNDYKINLAKFDFSNMRPYLDKCDANKTNAALSKKYIELMTPIDSILKQLVQDLRCNDNQNGAAIANGTQKSTHLWEAWYEVERIDCMTTWTPLQSPSPVHRFLRQLPSWNW